MVSEIALALSSIDFLRFSNVYMHAKQTFLFLKNQISRYFPERLEVFVDEGVVAGTLIVLGAGRVVLLGLPEKNSNKICTSM